MAQAGAAAAAAPLASARLTLTRAVRLLASRRVTSVQLCSYCHELAELGDRPRLGRQKQLDDASGGGNGGAAAALPGLGLNAFAQLASRDELLRHAAESDRRREAGLSLGPLDGIPISVKANVAVEGWGLTAASRILNGWDYYDGCDDNSGSSGSGPDAPAGCGFDADVVHRLIRTSGAVLVGTTNLDEFGMGSLGTRALPPRHVRRRRRRRLSSHSHDGRQRQPSSSSAASTPGDGSLVLNPLPYLRHLVPPFVVGGSDGRHHLHHHDEDELDDLWAHHVTTPLLWRHPDLLHSISHDASSSDSQKRQQHLTLSAGGSSSGSAASVSLGSSLLSIGTDTGGSVRLPAAWTGVVGFKPTYGLISRYGLVSYASSLDTVGVLVPTARCAALVLDAVSNRDGADDERCSGERDSTSVSVGVDLSVRDSMEEALFGAAGNHENLLDSETKAAPATAARQQQPLRGLTIGIPSAFSVAECPSTIRRAWQIGARRLQSAGATIRTVPPEVVRPETVKTSLAAYYVLACAEASSNLARYDGVEFGWDGPPVDHATEAGTNKPSNVDEERPEKEKTALSNLNPLESRLSRLRAQGFGPEVIRRILCGTSVLSSDRFHTHFEAAAKVRSIMARECNDAFDGVGTHGGGVDLMLVPTALSLPPDLGEDGSKTPDSTEMLANDVMTVPVSLAGLPSVSVPVRVEEEEGGGDAERESTIVGLQVFGPRLSEGQVLLAAYAVEDDA